MKTATIKIGDKLIILNGRDPLKYMDLATKKVYHAPAIYMDEANYMPSYKWWRQPIKWWRYRRLYKKIMKIPKFDTYRLQSTPSAKNPFGDSKINLRRKKS